MPNTWRARISSSGERTSRSSRSPSRALTSAESSRPKVTLRTTHFRGRGALQQSQSKIVRDSATLSEPDQRGVRKTEAEVQAANILQDSRFHMAISNACHQRERLSHVGERGVALPQIAVRHSNTQEAPAALVPVSHIVRDLQGRTEND